MESKRSTRAKTANRKCSTGSPMSLCSRSLSSGLALFGWRFTETAMDLLILAVGLLLYYVALPLTVIYVVIRVIGAAIRAAFR